MNKIYNEPKFLVVTNKSEDFIATSLEPASFAINNGFDVPNTETEKEFISNMFFI